MSEPRFITSPGRVPPRPHEEAPLARRSAIVAFAFLVAGSFSLAWHGVSLLSLQRAFPLYALGGIGTLIFGTSRLLIAGMAGRDAAGGRASGIATTALSGLGAAGLYLTQDIPTARILAAIVWASASALHVSVTFLTVARAPTRPPIVDPTATKASRVPIRLLEAGSLLYAALSAVLIPFTYAGRVPLASGIHAFLVGFVITTIMSVAAHILPRFTRARVPTSVLVALVPFALTGPILMILGLGTRRDLLLAGGLVEGAAFALFGAAVLATLARAQRLVRPPNLAYGAAPLVIGVGGMIALIFALRGELSAHLATHGLLATFGFAGLIVIGASTDLYAPSLAPGAAPAKRHALAAILVMMGALLLAAAGASSGSTAMQRAGMLLYGAAMAWQLVGIASAHRRAGRVLSRFRA